MAAAFVLGSACASLADPDETVQPSTSSPPTSAPGPSSTTVPTEPKAPGTDGLLTFRGNPTRTFYGTGPMPKRPSVLWRFPDEPMCSLSIDGSGETKWCGTGWTGQPAVVERKGRTWVVFGAYDRAVHFLDGATGDRLIPDFVTGDLIKGSVSFDPDGYPLVYTGSRDNHFRVIAVDRSVPEELWRLSAGDVSPVLWNNDWDGSGLVHDGYLYEGGENSQFHVVELNRSYGADGKVAADPRLAFNAPGWDAELLSAIPDKNVSIESSVAMWNGVVYFANSGGLVQGWDVSKVASGQDAERVFRYWMGDDVDATVVIDDEGMLYVGSEWERHLPRGREVGQLVKLDPRKDDPLVWSVDDQVPGVGRVDDVAGIWATPAIYKDLVVAATDGGRLMGVDRATGDVRWTKHLPNPVWQSPVVVDDMLLEGDCHGVLHAYDLRDTKVDPPELWTVTVPGCIESTPAVWKGRIYFGTREGHFYAVGDT
ncbi:MAG: hypothetical protein QOD63_2407 [Actinomycetota bacterium]|nr:hypothetical protein [Actinomycetota bacterium]